MKIVIKEKPWYRNSTALLEVAYLYGLKTTSPSARLE